MRRISANGKVEAALEWIQNHLESTGFRPLIVMGVHADAFTAIGKGLDAINALGIVGRETSKIALGTAVVPTYPRHPVAMAQQALTTQAASRGRKRSPAWLNSAMDSALTLVPHS